MRDGLNALLIDLGGAFSEAATLLPLRTNRYQLSAVQTVSEALALVSERAFDMVILEPSKRCPDSVWRVVEMIMQYSISDSLVMVHANAAGEDFYARASEFGAVVLSRPQGYVAIPPMVVGGAPV